MRLGSGDKASHGRGVSSLRAIHAKITGKAAHFARSGADPAGPRRPRKTRKKAARHAGKKQPQPIGLAARPSSSSALTFAYVGSSTHLRLGA